MLQAINRFRILFLDHTAKLGGGEIALVNLIRCLDRRRYEPIVILFADGPLRHELEAENVKVFVVPLKESLGNARKDGLGARSLFRLGDVLTACGFVWRLRSMIRQCQPDIVHTNSLKSHLLGGAAVKLAGLPLVWHMRDRIAEDYLPRKVVWVVRNLCRWLPDRIIANSHATLATLGPSFADDAPGAGQRHRACVVHDGTAVRPLLQNPSSSQGNSCNL